ncbi:Pvc16 family protein [Streptomyces sp. NPDC048595]|uniref:Pvc16 family protein n=1 Tax=Streptomyces sp. NPDC048595 TaxID=3365576 RepID=UPI003717F075
MSNALAVATVTQALALLIEHNLHPEIDMAVSVETRKPPADPPTDPTITVFLYQVTHNPSMRNNDLVTRASDGTLLKRPAAALDLHYVISAYGEETELVGQRLIGSVVRTLHEIPVLPRELVEEAAQRPYLAGSDLAESLQKVRFTPTQMDVDETSKLWGMLHNTPYALSVVYQASLVLLDGHQKPKPAKPVERPEVTVLPFGAPGAPQRPGTVGPGASVPPEAGAAGRTASGRTASAEQAAGGTAPGGTASRSSASGADAGAKGGVPAEGGKGAGAEAGDAGDGAAEARRADGPRAGGRVRAGRTAGASTRAARKAAASVGGSRAAKKAQPKREARGKQGAPAQPESSAQPDPSAQPESSAKAPDSGAGSGVGSAGSGSGSAGSGKEG